MGTFGKLSVKAPRESSEAAAGGRANTLTIFFEISSNFSKNEHQKLRINLLIKNSVKFGIIFIMATVIGLTLIITIIRSKYDNNMKSVRDSKSAQEQIFKEWASCTHDSDCFYLPHPCCPNWTSGSFNLSLVKSKPLNSSLCEPKPAECISAQPVILDGKIINPVCRNNKCTVKYEDKNIQKPIQMVIPCRESIQCPGPTSICGKNGYCIDESRQD